jgi:hypothetical protein
MLSLTANSRTPAIITLLVILLAFIVPVSGCTKKEVVPEPSIPSTYSTYTDEAGLFSISYPPDWEPALASIEQLESLTREIISSMNSDLPVEQGNMIFVCGLPVQDGYSPSVIIAINPVPSQIGNHNKMVESEVASLKKFLSDYQEFTRLKVTVDGREATIIDWEGTYPQVGKNHNLQMYMLVGKNEWIVGCTSKADEREKWTKDFEAVVRSLRILK